MKLIHTGNVYCYVLTEDEWYSGTDQQREAWEVECQRKAAEANCKYASIMVEPDDVMSISPIPTRHKVWGHTAPDTNEAAFRKELLDLFASYDNRLTATQRRGVMLKLLGK